MACAPKPTPEGPPDRYLPDFLGTFLAGKVGTASNLLNTAKRNFGESFETRISEMLLHIWEKVPDTYQLKIFETLREELAAIEHTCQPPPCRICCERDLLLASIALGAGDFAAVVDATDKLLEQHNDDIVALTLRGQARFFNEETNARELALAAALEDFSVADQLVAQLPDTQVFHVRCYRDIENPEFSAVIKKVHLVGVIRKIDPIRGGTLTNKPLPFSAVSTPVNVFTCTLKGMMGSVLKELNRYDEALPLLDECLSLARDTDDTEMITAMVYEIANIFLKLGATDAAVPFIVVGLVLADADADADAAFKLDILKSLTVCLSDLKRPADAVPALEELNDQWAGSDETRQAVVCHIFAGMKKTYGITLEK